MYPVLHRGGTPRDSQGEGEGEGEVGHDGDGNGTGGAAAKPSMWMKRLEPLGVRTGIAGAPQPVGEGSTPPVMPHWAAPPEMDLYTTQPRIGGPPQVLGGPPGMRHRFTGHHAGVWRQSKLWQENVLSQGKSGDRTIVGYALHARPSVSIAGPVAGPLRLSQGPGLCNLYAPCRPHGRSHVGEGAEPEASGAQKLNADPSGGPPHVAREHAWVDMAEGGSSTISARVQLNVAATLLQTTTQLKPTDGSLPVPSDSG